MKMPIAIDRTRKNMESTLCGPVFVAVLKSPRTRLTAFCIPELQLDGSLLADEPIVIMDIQEALNLEQLEFDVYNKSEFITQMTIKIGDVGVHVSIDDNTKTVQYEAFKSDGKHIIQMGDGRMYRW